MIPFCVTFFLLYEICLILRAKKRELQICHVRCVRFGLALEPLQGEGTTGGFLYFYSLPRACLPFLMVI